MNRSPLELFLSLSLMLALLLPVPIEAGKGRSYSSGGSSFGRGSSSSFSRSSGGGSSSSRSSGRSYSSGGSSRARSSPAPSFSKPSAGSKPPRPSFDSAAAAAQRRQVSKQSFDVRRTSPQGRSSSARPPTPARTPTGRNYSSGQSKSSASMKRSAGGNFDRAAATARRREESKAVFTQGTKPRTTYTTSNGEKRPIDAGDKRVEAIRRNADPRRWTTREQRRRQTFPNPSPPPVVIYHDPYSNWFWWWLLTRDQNTRALWAYHHQSDMDAARYRDLLAKDQKMEERIHELEAKKVPRDSTYSPPELDPDLMYDDGFVEAAVNPQPPPPAPPSRQLPRAVWRIVLILAGMAFFVWLVFIKRWGGD